MTTQVAIRMTTSSSATSIGSSPAASSRTAPPLLTSLTVAPLTRTARGIPSELPVAPADGVRVESVASFDDVTTTHRAYFTRLLGRVEPARWHEVCAAMRVAIGC